MKRSCAAVLAALCAAPATGAPVQGTASLRCGGAVLSASTVLDAHMPPDDAFGYLSQTITLRPAANRAAKTLHAAPRQLMQLPSGQSVLAAIVQSWACLPARSGAHYLLLDIACQRDDSAGACAGQAERFPVYTLTGIQLAAGISPQTAHDQALYARLGISVNGVKMQDATGP